MLFGVEKDSGCGREKKISACQLVLHGSRELVEMVYFYRRLAYVSRRVRFFSRWRLRALSQDARDLENSRGATATGLRRARSPQRVRRPTVKFARWRSETCTICTMPSDGSLTNLKIRTAPQREQFDTRDPRRGFTDDVESLHGATVRALQHARSRQSGASRRPPPNLPQAKKYDKHNRGGVGSPVYVVYVGGVGAVMYVGGVGAVVYVGGVGAVVYVSGVGLVVFHWPV